MKIEAGDYQVWDDFSLRISSDLEFGPGTHYLSGANGSGKSSLLTKLILPRLQKTTDVYSVYFEQQMHLQVMAIKAYASVIRPHRKIDNEADTVDFLLDNLLRSWQIRQRPCYIVMDESLLAEHVYNFLHAKLPSFTLIYSAHSVQFPASQNLSFKALSPILSEVYVHNS